MNTISDMESTHLDVFTFETSVSNLTEANNSKECDACAEEIVPDIHASADVCLKSPLKNLTVPCLPKNKSPKKFMVQLLAPLFLQSIASPKRFRMSTPPAGISSCVTVVPTQVGPAFSGILLLTSMNGLKKMNSNGELKNATVVSFFDENNVEIECKRRIVCLLHDNFSGVNDMHRAIDTHAQYIIDLLCSGEKVVVHCHAGISRSVAFVCAILLIHAKANGITNYNVKNAVEHIRNLRLDPEDPERHLNETDVTFGFYTMLSVNF